MVQAQAQDGLVLLEAVESMNSSEVSIAEYRSLVTKFQEWKDGDVELAKRAQAVLRRVYPYVQKELEGK